MDSSISDLIISFEDTEVLHKIAESFEKKKNTAQASKIYHRLLEIDPADDKALRKRTYFKALEDPLNVDEENLPAIDLIKDLETLRSIEINYLQYKGTFADKKGNSKPVSEVSRKIKKRKRKKKIRWPKGFDPTNPKHTRVKPDQERWLPKLERQKYRGLAKKKGYVKRTQGTTNVDDKAERGNFKKGPSTATVQAVKSKSKYRRKRRR